MGNTVKMAGGDIYSFKPGLTGLVLCMQRDPQNEKVRYTIMPFKIAKKIMLVILSQISEKLPISSNHAQEVRNTFYHIM